MTAWLPERRLQKRGRYESTETARQLTGDQLD